MFDKVPAWLMVGGIALVAGLSYGWVAAALTLVACAVTALGLLTAVAKEN